MKNCYTELEIEPRSSQEEIKSAFRKLSKEYHPDKMPPGTPEVAKKYIEEKYKAINEAYSILVDPEKRSVHDQNLLFNHQNLQSPSIPYHASHSNSSQDSFDQEKVDRASKELEKRFKAIEDEYNLSVEAAKENRTCY